MLIWPQGGKPPKDQNELLDCTSSIQRSLAILIGTLLAHFHLSQNFNDSCALVFVCPPHRTPSIFTANVSCRRIVTQQLFEVLEVISRNHFPQTARQFVVFPCFVKHFNLFRGKLLRRLGFLFLLGSLLWGGLLVASLVTVTKRKCFEGKRGQYGDKLRLCRNLNASKP